MNLYKIIQDEVILDDFISWLPDLEDGEKFYVCLLARKKYCSDISSTKTDKAQLKRFLATKHNLKLKLSQLEIPIGRYLIGDQIAPQESLAVYITANPRSMRKATGALMKTLTDYIINGNYIPNIHQQAMSEVHRNKARTYRIGFDVDSKDIYLDSLGTLKQAVDILETRGGYHLLVNPEKASVINKKWHSYIGNAFPEIDSGSHSDDMIPIPGCSQGGFIPHFV